MASDAPRYTSPNGPAAGGGWTVERLTRPSRLYGANGLRTGRDGRIYVAQVGGSQVSAIDPDTAEITTVSPMGGSIVAPDDLVFDDTGNLYLTEITEGRVSMLAPDGTARVVRGDLPVANPITMHDGRLLAGECRPGGRIYELGREDGVLRMILDDVPMPNAFSVGPDGKLYVPVMGANQIWRVDLAGGGHEVVAGDLGVPDSVKFDAQGFIVSTQVASGQVLRIDPRDGSRQVLAQLSPGLDNCTFVGERLFVSSIPGSIWEIVAPGDARPLVPDGLQWPLGLAVGADGGLFVADGGWTYTMQPGGGPDLAGFLFSPGFPGYTRGAAAAPGGGGLVTTGHGDVALFDPAGPASKVLASGYDILMGVAAAPRGGIVFAEYGGGRVLALDGGVAETLASGLDKPMGVAIGVDGAVYAAEAGAGRIVTLAGGRAETVVDGLGRPEGLVAAGDRLFVVDTAAKAVIAIDADGRRETVASGLPVGAPAGVTPKFLGPIGNLAGPMVPFAGIAAGADGTLYVAGDAEGSVLAVRPA